MNRLVAEKPEKSIPKAVIKKARPGWLFWLVPLGAAALCVWFVYRDFIASGPLITLYFENVDGVQPGNTPVRFRGAQVGEVKTMSVVPDLKKIKVTARLTGDAKDMAREGSIFWIVRPEVKVGAISGLQTIVSGDYINVQPGHGARTNVFTAAAGEPLQEIPGALHITIRSSALNSLQDRSPLFYRGIQVGEVIGYQLAGDSASVTVRLRVRPEYAPLVRANSEFWNAGGVDVHVGLFKGIQVSAESTQSLLSGGIAFATPPNPGAPAEEGAVFELNDKPKDEWTKWAPDIPLKLPQQAPATSVPSSASAFGK
jgi:paraquat-inducible protein B